MNVCTDTTRTKIKLFLQSEGFGSLNSFYSFGINTEAITGTIQAKLAVASLISVKLYSLDVHSTLRRDSNLLL